VDMYEFVEALRGADSATVSDSIESLKVRNRTEGYADVRLRNLISQPEPMVGFALTMKVDSTSPGRIPDPSGFNHLRRELFAARLPCVVVIQEAGPHPERGCHMGDVVGTMLARNGVVGVVSGSGIRDLNGLRQAGLSAFALGTVVSHGVWTITEAGGEVEVAGLRVRPGQLLHGDGNGLVTVPTERPAELLDLIEKLRAHEAERRRTAGKGWTGWSLPPAEPSALY
jgi:4-hydroxy-4-methyl-2-oxoglutarate aldolase